MTPLALRYAVYRSLHSRYVYVMPVEREPFAQTVKLNLGFVTEFSHDAAVSFAARYAKVLDCKIVFIDCEANV